jgi:hypothetical protein
MFSVKWVTHHNESKPIEIERVHLELDEVVAACIARLPKMRLDRIKTSPDGFLVCDEAGREVRRWFGSSRFKLMRATC